MAHTKLPRRFSALDAIFIDIESPVAPMHIGSVCIYDGRISLARFVKHVASRLHLLPRYRQVMVPTPLHLGYPTWRADPDFDIFRHIFEVTAPAQCTVSQLSALSGRILGKMLDRDKPLWELYLVNGLEGGRSAIISKVHHCLADGITGVELGAVMHDHRRKPIDVPVTDNRPRRNDVSARPILDALWDTAVEEVTRWTEAKQGAAKFLESLSFDTTLTTWKEVLGVVRTFSLPIDRMPFNAHRLSGRKRLAWCEHSFAEVRAVRAALGGTVNDVMLTVVGLAVRRYLKAHGVRPDRKTLRVMVPVSLRHEHERGQMGNRVSMLPVQIPLGIDDPIELFERVHAHTTRLKEIHIAHALHGALRAIQAGPMLQSAVGRLTRMPAVSTLLTTFSGFPAINTVVTNVPGPQIPLYLLGRRMTAYYPYLPVAPEVSVTFGILTYNQTLAVSVIADAAAMPDIARMRRHLETAYGALRTAAGVPERPHVPVHL
ncbi:MAG: wax ester/triacylglycerol synthase family O-acyltransferase [Candidatus Hydrogenedentes bacterium]|nr:wax ester/triacylglycerol synthase family O-acyltransferase [Candidatus Hydrogenedentota bacterium]